MSDKNLEEFLRAFSGRKQTIVKQELQYRLYYNSETGEPNFYTMEQHHDGTYLEITKEEYELSDYNIRVKDNKIVPYEAPQFCMRLIKGDVGTPTLENNILIIEPTSNTKWSLKNVN